MLELVTAVLQPYRLEVVKDALNDIGVAGMTVSEARGFGRQGSHTETYRGAEYQVDFVPKVMITLLCKSEDTAGIVDAITGAAGSGGIGDGKIWVTPVSEAVRIRTGERGLDAV
jgi:nitrogen regulatory protein P-II 1